jgi:hypothetical protein
MIKQPDIERERLGMQPKVTVFELRLAVEDAETERVWHTSTDRLVYGPPCFYAATRTAVACTGSPPSGAGCDRTIPLL